MCLEDMLGSTKLSGLARHTFNHGDRFSLVQAAKSSLVSGAKSLYYPINPPQSHLYNSDRLKYSLKDLPYRTEKQFWETHNQILEARNITTRERIVKMTGIVKITIVVISLAFLFPEHFLIDSFHLFYENCTAFMWDI